MSSTHRPTGTALALAACLLVSGCYSAETLVKKVRSKATRSRLEEVDLGSYRVTLPRDERTTEAIEVDVRLFGEAPRYKVKKIRAELKGKTPQVEDKTVRTLRETTHDELAEPDLVTLRARLLESMNSMLEDDPIESIGFHDVRFIRH